MDEKDISRGIAREKTRESMAVFAALGAALLGWIVGEATAGWAGVATIIVLFVLIYRWYRR